ncbi:MAG TPA: hypothetical protein VEH28_03365 [Thermoplasmata archaeon]|nr:hypothetical protein [Thermoplasmata archaeon]
MGSEAAEVWGYAFFAATLIGMGAIWFVVVVLSPLLQSKSPSVDPYYSVFPAIFVALGCVVAWESQRAYRKRQRARSQPPPPSGAPP